MRNCSSQRQRVQAPLGASEVNNYFEDRELGANFVTVDHLLINQLVWEAFQESCPIRESTCTHHGPFLPCSEYIHDRN
jgi:RNA-splicing ligase RtcB